MVCGFHGASSRRLPAAGLLTKLTVQIRWLRRRRLRSPRSVIHTNMDASRVPHEFHGSLSIHELFICFLRPASTYKLCAQTTEFLSQQVMRCNKEASDTRVDVQGFGWSCCRRLPFLGCRRVRITLLVADFSRNTSSREIPLFPANAVNGHGIARLLLVTQER